MKKKTNNSLHVYVFHNYHFSIIDGRVYLQTFKTFMYLKHKYQNLLLN